MKGRVMRSCFFPALLAGALCSTAVFAADAPATSNSRYALIIGVGHYSKSSIPSLQGVQHDMVSARQMANSMGIPDDNIRYLRDDEATSEHIKQAIQQLNQRLHNGDRLFVYYSGHGTRWHEPTNPDGICTEGLVASDGNVLSNREIGKLLEPLAKKTDKMMVFYDACFSGGVVATPMKTRALTFNNMVLTPKFTSATAPTLCFDPSNFKTRSLNSVLKDQGGLPQNIVHIAASKSDEVSFDNSQSGGLATTAWRDCLQGEAKDLDGSGAITVDEITQCAQAKLDNNLANQPGVLGQHMTIGGNKQFVPAWIKSAFVAPSDSTPTHGETEANSRPLRQASPADILEQIHAQRDGGRELKVELKASQLKIGQDKLAMSITSPQDGYLYIALAGSDSKSLYLLYPNRLDSDNAIKAGQTVQLPRKAWQIDAGGPVGRDSLLVMVTDSPRQLKQLKAEAVGPFMQTLLDMQGRSLLQQVLATSDNGRNGECSATLRNLQVSKRCSDAFASSLLNLQEVE
ncbi:caspase family protein [Crenobacter sp. SG2303]|uniref:Caspase family protein n=1 Tax=Crenobacter oryzisoli TaxID=3056844 RepID=A0ABT7XMT9_9NEIS|nr:caspase family protein [Crenobacter sp. SG2303]MDN0075107.1 caspase family protein [Crenobacter sp. SG2303]